MAGARGIGQKLIAYWRGFPESMRSIAALSAVLALASVASVLFGLARPLPFCRNVGLAGCAISAVLLFGVVGTRRPPRHRSQPGYAVRHYDLTCTYHDDRRMHVHSRAVLHILADGVICFDDRYRWIGQFRRRYRVLQPAGATVSAPGRRRSGRAPAGAARGSDVYRVRFRTAPPKGMELVVEVEWELTAEEGTVTSYIALAADAPTEQVNVCVTAHRPIHSPRVIVQPGPRGEQPLVLQRFTLDEPRTLSFRAQPQAGERYLILWQWPSPSPEPTPARPAARWQGEGAPRLVRILHLSDLHLGTPSDARRYRTQLETDLRAELGISRLDYLVISGDVANRCTPAEYDAARLFVEGLSRRLSIAPQRIIVAPGNHDLSWEISRQAYLPVSQAELPDPLPTEAYIPQGPEGGLLRDEALYRRRFEHFGRCFYKPVCGLPYPSDYEAQGLLHPFSRDRLLFLTLNSAWQVDHHFRARQGIHMDALAAALDQLQGRYEDWLKIAVFHHPVAGPEMMDEAFLQLLTVHGFRLCLHGHIHEAAQGFYRYDSERGLHIVGAGTFGAWTRELAPGIPWQYNLLVYDLAAGTITVETRKRERANGAWMADARWGR